MKRVWFAAAGISLIVVFAAGLFRFAMAGRVQPAHDSPQIAFYRCPMHPSDTSDGPGVSVCGMARVPVYDAPSTQSQGPSVIRATGEQQQIAGIRVTSVERKVHTGILRTLGRVAVDETRDYRVVAGADGWVTEVYPEATTGHHVAAGQPLIAVTGREFTTAQRTFLFALQSFELAGKADEAAAADRFSQRPGVVFEEARLDLRRLGLGDRQIEEIRSSRDIKLSVALASPASGIVITRSARQGEAFVKGAELFRVADLQHMWLLADLVSADAANVRNGDRARVTGPGRHDAASSATVTNAVGLFDSETRTIKVRLEAENSQLLLRPDMFVDLELPVRMPESVNVPVDAVRDTGGRSFVFVRVGDTAFEAREVTTGWRLGDRVEIVTGLKRGELVVESGAFLLDSERRLRSSDTGGHDGHDD
jgi:Cu(I)/Ag(I) efflux system membrane fusion protein